MINIIKSEEYIVKNRDETIKQLATFFLTDTLVFWSNEKDIFCLQKEKWQPLLDILQQKFSLKINITTSLNSSDNGNTQKTFTELLRNMQEKELTACFLASLECKSPLIGLLLAKKQISASEAFNAAFLEELYQNEFWGTDAAVANKHKQIQQTLSEIEGYLIA